MIVYVKIKLHKYVTTYGNKQIVSKAFSQIKKERNKCMVKKQKWKQINKWEENLVKMND